MLVVGDKSQGQLAAQVAQNLSFQGQILPLLVVSLEHQQGNAEFYLNESYSSAYQPSKLAGDQLLQHIRAEVLPALREQFSVAPYSVLCGHSLGALFTLGTMAQQPSSFQAYIAAAPPVYQWQDPERVYRTFLVGYPEFSGTVYLTMGFGDDAMMAETLKFTRLFQAHSVERPMDYHFELVEDESNASLFQHTLYQGLKHIFRDVTSTTMLAYGGIDRLWQRKKNLIAKYGYDPLHYQLPRQAFTQAIPVNPTGPADLLRAEISLLLNDNTKRYDQSAIHLQNLIAYWRSQGLDEPASVARELGTLHFPDQHFETKNDRRDANINHYGVQEDLSADQVLYLNLDQAASGSDGVEVVAPTHNARGQVGNAQSFDGQSSLWKLNLSEFDGYTGSFSFSAWVHPDTLRRYNRFMGKTTTKGDYPVWQIGFGPLADTQWGLSTYQYGWKDYWINDAVPTGEWSHLAVVVDQSLGRVTYYRNGKQVGRQSGILPFAPSDQPILLGSNAMGEGHFQGKLDELYLYQRALSAEEVNALYLKAK